MTILYPIPAVRDAWADLAVPTTDIVDPGNNYVAAGWLQSTQPPPRQYMNWVLNWCAAGIRYYMQNGICDWQAAELYQTGSIVVYNNVVWQSLTNGNTNYPPTTNPTQWGPLAGYATIAMLASYVTQTTLSNDLAAYAALNSPTFSGNPQAPTPVLGDSDNSIATSAFVQATLAAALSAYVTQTSLTSQLGGYLTIASAAATYAKLASPTFSGTPTAPTPATGDNSTRLATTAFVKSAFATSASLAVNGYQDFPSGLIIQWGIASPGGSPGSTVPFPKPFPASCFAVIAGAASSSGGAVAVTGWNASGSVQYNTSGGFNSWIAVGH